MEGRYPSCNTKKTVMGMFWTIIDRYIFRRMMVTFIYTLILFNMISVVFDFVEHIDDFIKRDAPNSAVASFLITFFPWITGLLAHLFLFISVIFFTSRMANNTEIIPLEATGMSFRRFLRPYMVGATIIFAILLVAKNYTIPLSNKIRFRIQDTYLFPPSKNSEKNKHVRIGPTDYAYTENYSMDRNKAMRFTLERFDTAGNLLEKITSLEASYDSASSSWNMTNVTDVKYTKTGQDISYQPSRVEKLDLAPQDFFEEVRPREEYTSGELRERIAKSKKLGLGTANFLYVELYKRTAESFAVFIFVLIGASVGAKKTRGGSGIHLALGIVICLIYAFTQQMAYTFSIKSGLDPLLAAWLPNIIFGFVALYYYRLRMS